MSTLQYKRSYKVTSIQKTTVMRHSMENICHFEVHGGDWSDCISGFNREYVESRKQLFKDMGYGPWSEEKDFGLQNYLRVLESGDYTLEYYEVEVVHHVPAQVLCCEEWMNLNKFTNTCSYCGSDYNESGQLLDSRENWGEETGEHWTDCI